MKIGVLSNGRTTVSGTVCEGSTPSTPECIYRKEYKRPYRLVRSRTPPSHGGDSGSNPGRAKFYKASFF